MVEYTKKECDNLVKASQEKYDKQLINFISENQKIAGYDLNPYEMSSSQKEYWSNRIVEKVKNDTEKKIDQIDKF